MATSCTSTHMGNVYIYNGNMYKHSQGKCIYLWRAAVQALTIAVFTPRGLVKFQTS